MANGYDQKMSQRSLPFRGLVQLTNPTAVGGTIEFPPSNVLRRQDGWNQVHDKNFFENTPMPYQYGVNELEHDFAGRVSSIWKTKQEGQESWAADFEDGELTIIRVTVLFQIKYEKVWKLKDQIKNWTGTQIFIGDQICGTVGQGKDQSWLTHKLFGEIVFNCPIPIKGSSVKVVFPKNAKAAISDVQVFQTLPRPDHLHEPSPLYANTTKYCAEKNKDCWCRGIVYYGKGDDWVSKNMMNSDSFSYTQTIKCTPENFNSSIKFGVCKCFNMVNYYEYGETLLKNPFTV